MINFINFLLNNFISFCDIFMFNYFFFIILLIKIWQTVKDKISRKKTNRTRKYLQLVYSAILASRSFRPCTAWTSGSRCFNVCLHVAAWFWASFKSVSRLRDSCPNVFKDLWSVNSSSPPTYWYSNKNQINTLIKW